MNSTQRIILSIGLFFLFLSCVFVPWSTRGIGEVNYSPIWSKPLNIMIIEELPNIDTTKFIIQLLAISFLTAFGVILAGFKKKA